MANKPKKRYLISLTIKEMKIKTMRRYCYTPIRMVKIKNADNTTYQRGCGIISTHIAGRNVKWYSNFW